LWNLRAAVGMGCRSGGRASDLRIESRRLGTYLLLVWHRCRLRPTPVVAHHSRRGRSGPLPLHSRRRRQLVCSKGARARHLLLVDWHHDRADARRSGDYRPHPGRGLALAIPCHGHSRAHPAAADGLIPYYRPSAGAPEHQCSRDRTHRTGRAREQRGAPGKALKSVDNVWKNYRFWLATIAISSNAIFFWGWSIWLPTYLRTERHFSFSTSGYLTFVIFGFAVATILIVGYLS